jgi:hypothetical protein
LGIMKTSYPTECVLWKTDNLSIDQLRQIFEVIVIYEDDSHLIRKLLRCKECGHLYFKEFYEEIDWIEGKDAQYQTWIPVDDAESGKELNKVSPIMLLSYPSIRYDYPMGADEPRGPYWNCNKNL